MEGEKGCVKKMIEGGVRMEGENGSKCQKRRMKEKRRKGVRREIRHDLKHWRHQINVIKMVLFL